MNSKRHPTRSTCSFIEDDTGVFSRAKKLFNAKFRSHRAAELRIDVIVNVYVVHDNNLLKYIS